MGVRDDLVKRELSYTRVEPLFRRICSRAYNFVLAARVYTTAILGRFAHFGLVRFHFVTAVDRLLGFASFRSLCQLSLPLPLLQLPSKQSRFNPSLALALTRENIR